MATHSTGPQKNTVLSRGNREWFSGQPVGQSPDVIAQTWDWLSAQELDTTNVWEVVKDSGAAVAIAADADGGELTITSAATTDNDGGLIQSVQESYSLSSGKQTWLEARVKMSDATQSELFFGLATSAATNPEATLAVADRCGFQKNDGAATLLAKSEKNGTETSTTTSKSLANDTYVKLGIHWDGQSTVKFFVDRAKVATHTANTPDDEQLAIVLYSLSGDDSGTKVATCDYITVLQER